MKSTKETTHAFILRIWLESREKQDAEPVWRGVIEPVSDGKPMYFINLDQVLAYLAAMIEAMGGKISRG